MQGTALFNMMIAMMMMVNNNGTNSTKPLIIATRYILIMMIQEYMKMMSSPCHGVVSFARTDFDNMIELIFSWER